MTGYAIFQIEITNPEEYKNYVAKASGLVAKYGGEYLVRGGDYECVEGEWKLPRTVVVKFPSYEKALEFYNSEEYKPVRQIRLDNSVGNVIIIKKTKNKEEIMEKEVLVIVDLKEGKLEKFMGWMQSDEGMSVRK